MVHPRQSASPEAVNSPALVFQGLNERGRDAMLPRPSDISRIWIRGKSENKVDMYALQELNCEPSSSGLQGVASSDWEEGREISFLLVTP